MITIHQPNQELLSMFDNAIVLVKGQCVFSGAVADAHEYFQQYGYMSPTTLLAEHILHVCDTVFYSSEASRQYDFPQLFRQSTLHDKLISVSVLLITFKRSGVVSIALVEQKHSYLHVTALIVFSGRHRTSCRNLNLGQQVVCLLWKLTNHEEFLLFQTKCTLTQKIFAR